METKKQLESSPCPDCGLEVGGQFENYRYDESGIDNVVLNNIPVYRCECGNIRIHIDVDEVHRKIARYLIAKTETERLKYKEAKFICDYVTEHMVGFVQANQVGEA